MGGFVGRFYLPAQFKAIFAGHHHIGNDEIGRLGHNQLPCLFSVPGNASGKLLPDFIRHIIAQFVVVFHDQNGELFHAGGFVGAFRCRRKVTGAIGEGIGFCRSGNLFFDVHLPVRNHNFKEATFIFLAFDRNGASENGNIIFYHQKPDSRTHDFCVDGIFATVKLSEKLPLVLFADADSVVSDGKGPPVFLSPEFHEDLSVVMRIFDGIRNQVIDDFFHFGLIDGSDVTFRRGGNMDFHTFCSSQ